MHAAARESQPTGATPAHILVADDEEAKRYALVRMLQLAGYRVSEAAEGWLALEEAARGVDLIVLDLRLPDVDGFELTRRLRADPQLADIPIIQITGAFIDESQRAAGLQSGAEAYLTWPVSREVLLAQVEALLRGKAPRADGQGELVEYLRTREAHLHVAISTAGLGVWERDLATGSLSLDARCRAILGVEADEALTDAAMLGRMHPDDRHRYRESFEAALAGGRNSGTFEYRLGPDPDGHWRTVRSGWRVILREGRPAVALGTLEDITAARERETFDRFLSEAGAALLDATPAGESLERICELCVPLLGDWAAVDVVQDHGSLRRAAQHHADAEQKRQGQALAARLPPQREDQVGVGAVARTGEPECYPHLDARQAQVPISPASREKLVRLGLCSYLAVPLRARGQVLGVLSFAYAESRRHHRREHLALAQELADRAALALENARLLEVAERERHRAEDASAAKDHMLAVVSHELRNPLSAIAAQVHLARAPQATPERREKALAAIDRSARSIGMLVDDLVDSARIAAGKLKLELQPMEPADAAEEALETVRGAAERQGVQLLASIQRPSGPVTADPGRLKQVIWNLLSNAVKFTPSGGQVSLRVERRESELELEVQDTGRGIEPELLPHVFERFRQGKDASRRGGLGLGLNIVRYLVQQHGGTVQALSDGAGKGATFVVRLPIGPR